MGEMNLSKSNFKIIKDGIKGNHVDATLHHSMVNNKCKQWISQ